MTDFIEQLQLAEKAQEDIYFARINRRLIEALHRKLATDSARTKVVAQPKGQDTDALEGTEAESQAP